MVEAIDMGKPPFQRGDRSSSSVNHGVIDGGIDLDITAKDYAKTEDTAYQRRLDEDRLAEDIIEECRVQLMLKFRFLDRALWRMDLISVRSGMAYALATDGRKTYYDPQRLIARFQQSFDETVRDYLHLIMHCIFRHPYDRLHKVPEAWSLTCDMIVESVVMDLCRSRFPSEEDGARQSALDEVMMHVGSLIPNKVYEFLKNMVRTPEGQQHQGLSRSKLNEWHQLFERDDHASWPSNHTDGPSESDGEPLDPEEMMEDDEDPDLQDDGMRTETLGSDDSGEEESRSNPLDDPAAEDEGEQEVPDEEGEDPSSEMPIEDSSVDPEKDQEESYKDWEEIAKEIEMNLETFSKQWGEEAGNFVSSLALANRRTYDYTDFLRRFMTVTEQIKLNPEEFDYTYYMFGMELYDNMPFIEPLEYKESESIRDFVIAVDTSESVNGPLVKKFIQHTFSILMEARDRATDVNIHVIQADSKVQSDLRIKDLRDIDILMDGFTIRGFGGTDFRPAFDHVQFLRDCGDLSDMKGMIYFTDGIGQFPEKAPDFDVAFVFVDDGQRELPPVPPWAMKVTLDERAIDRLPSHPDAALTHG